MRSCHKGNLRNPGHQIVEHNGQRSPEAADVQEAPHQQRGQQQAGQIYPAHACRRSGISQHMAFCCNLSSKQQKVIMAGFCRPCMRSKRAFKAWTFGMQGLDFVSYARTVSSSQIAHVLRHTPWGILPEAETQACLHWWLPGAASRQHTGP